MFADEKYIQAFKDKHEFPKIHDNIFKLLSKVIPPGNIMDLGSCTGLLAQRIAEAGYKVIAVERDLNYINRAVFPTIHLNISKNNLEQLKKIIEVNQIKTVVARRVIPELYDSLGDDICQLVNILSECKMVILEGRILSKKSVHKFKSIEDEIKLFEQYFDVCERKKNCAVLERKKECSKVQFTM